MDRLSIRKSVNTSGFQSLFQFIFEVPFIIWVFIAFLIAYLLFFVEPILFSSQVMQFPRYIPAVDPIGVDLKQMLSYSESWFFAKQTPYIGANLYPPLASVFFTPLLSVRFFFAYRIITVTSILFYILMTLALPLKISPKGQVTSLLMPIFVTGLFSYGFQFELERGQFNIIATFLCFLAIYMYHFHNKMKYLAYLLFILSVQLKIFPFIFIVMFVTHWRD